MHMYIAQKENVQETECFDLLLFFCYLYSNTQCVAIYIRMHSNEPIQLVYTHLLCMSICNVHVLLLY